MTGLVLVIGGILALIAALGFAAARIRTGARAEVEAAHAATDIAITRKAVAAREAARVDRELHPDGLRDTDGFRRD